MPHPFAIVLPVLAGLAAQPAARVGPPSTDELAPVWVVIDSELKTRAAAAVVSLDDKNLVVSRDGEKDLTLPRAQVLAIVPANWALPASPEPWSMLPGGTRPRDLAVALLELSDGTRIVGAPAPGQTTGELIGWANPSLPDARVRLDQIRRIVLRPVERAPGSPPPNPAPAPAAAALADRVELTNGDNLTGLVTGFAPGPSPGRVSLTIEARGSADQPAQTRTIDLDRVASIAFANPPAAPPPVRVWLDDGSVVGGASLTVSSEREITLKPVQPAGDGGTPSTITIPLVRAEALVIGGARLAALSRQPFSAEVQGPGVVSVEPDQAKAPVLDASVIRLSAPAKVTFTLPAGARRIAGTLILPERARLWGDCTVSLSAGGREILTHRLTGQTPTLSFNTAVSGDALTITLQPASGGASVSVQDEVEVHHAVVLVD
jgi:hypothetical protein